ncbi:MAG: hypothetical protein KAH21_03615 [Spirochaetaceae bacterium]|nr:hypothetical protein [Spirochaetaceae bacterium]
MLKKPFRSTIFAAWLPLAMMWIIMAVEQPVIAAVVARMSEAKLQLAAFGFTFSVALFFSGPVVQMLAAGTAVADNQQNYKRLLWLMHAIGWSATAIHAILCIPSVFKLFARGVIGIPEELLFSSRLTLISMLPWTLAVGYRRLWQGVLIRNNRTKVIPIIMLIRLTVSFATLIFGFRTRLLPGAALGGLALSLGAIAEAISAWLFVRPVIAEFSTAGSPAAADRKYPAGVMTWSAMLIFYIPLALTNFMNLGVWPIMQIGMARGPMSLDSLALWPVSMGYLFLYSSFSLSSQEIVIARLDGPDSRRDLVHFITKLSAVLSILYIIVLVTPLWRGWFSGVSGLSRELTDLAMIPILLNFPIILIYPYISLYRGALVRLHRTREVTIGVAINVTVMLGTLFLGVNILPIPAISTVAGAYTLAFISEFFYLVSRRSLAPFKH